MPSLSFDIESKEEPKPRPVAIVKGGNDNGNILYLHEGKGKAQKKSFNKSKYMNMLKMKPMEKTKVFIKLEEALKKDVPVESLTESKEVKEVYEKILNDSTSDKSVELDDEGDFELIPNPEPTKRSVWYIAGQSGSGKSYIAKTLANYYHKLFPERGIYLVSKLEKDETLDALKFIKRLNIQSFVEDYPSIDEFKDTMMIFDDYDCLTGDAEKVVLKIIDDLAITGRHSNTTMLCLSHYLTNYKKTRLLLNEATHVVVYPQSTSYHALRYLLKSYVGVDEDVLKRLRKNGSRWLAFFKGFPSICISQKGAELLHV